VPEMRGETNVCGLDRGKGGKHLCVDHRRRVTMGGGVGRCRDGCSIGVICEKTERIGRIQARDTRERKKKVLSQYNIAKEARTAFPLQNKLKGFGHGKSTMALGRGARKQGP